MAKNNPVVFQNPSAPIPLKQDYRAVRVVATLVMLLLSTCTYAILILASIGVIRNGST